MSLCESSPIKCPRSSADDLKWLKPGTTDPDYLCQQDENGQWHYRLAIDDLLQELLANGSDEEIQEAYRQYQKPLWQYRPLPQARKFHRSRKPNRWCLGGNRSSKTRSVSAECLYRALGQHPFRPDITAPRKIWYVATTWDKAGTSLWAENLKYLIQGFEHRIVWHNPAKQIPEIIFIPLDGGGESFIQFKTLEQGREEFQSASINDVFFDEQFPQSIFMESISRIGSEAAAETAASLTPINSQPWLEKRLLTEKLECDDIFEFPLDDNRDEHGGFIPSERITALIESWPPEVRETRRLGKWGAYLGAIFQSFKRETHVVDEAREKEVFFLPGRTMQATVGVIDWGGSNPFAMIFACRIPHLDDDWYVYDEIYWDHRSKGGRRLADLAGDIKAKLSSWKTHLSRCYADHDPTNVLEMRHCGVATTPAVKVGTQDEVSRIGIEAIQSLLQPRAHLTSQHWPGGRPRLHIAARCENLIREMALYRWSEVPEGAARSPKNVPIKTDDHCIDCLRYLVATEARQAPKLPDLGSYPRTFR